jgi:prepilin-type processing-associated H-X9-DG protein
MSQVSTLVTGAGIDTIINLPYVPEVLLIGESDTDLPIQGLSIQVGGKDYQNIQSQALIQAFSKWKMEGMLGADVKIAQRIPISNGFIAGQNCQIRLTNAGATTPAIYAYSQGKGDDVLEAGTLTVQAQTSQVFPQFMALFFDPANLDYANITFLDGHQDKFTAAELRAMFAEMNETDADGELAGLICIDNTAEDDEGEGYIASAELWTTNGGTCTVLVAK